MKLTELKNIFEEAIQARPAKDVWEELESESKIFVSKQVFVAKLNDDDEYEVFVETGAKRTAYATMPIDDFEKAFTKINKSTSADVEGFEKYRDAQEIKAVKYNGETIKVIDGPKALRLSKGDYLIKTDDGDDFFYSVEKSSVFELENIEK